MKIAVCSVFRMAGVTTAWRPDAIVSTLPPSFRSVPIRDGVHRQLLTFHDIEEAIAGRRYGPAVRHLRSFLDFIVTHEPGRLLIVCAAGLSRSPAMAIVAAVMDGAPIKDACHAVAEAIPKAKPNRRVLSLGGDVLGIGEALVAEAARLFDYDRTSDITDRTSLVELRHREARPQSGEDWRACTASAETLLVASGPL